MESTPGARSVKISDDERGGWSSDRPRKGGAPKPDDFSVRCKVLKPSYAMRYSPGSLLLIVSAAEGDRDRFSSRLIENKNSLLSLEKVKSILEGRVPEGELDGKATELLEAAVAKRLGAGDTVVITTQGLDPEERAKWIKMAATNRRPRHIIMLETRKDDIPEDQLQAVNDLRTKLDTGGLGEEGFHSALRLGGDARMELKKIAFQPAPRDD
jgi:predicted kinase